MSPQGSCLSVSSSPKNAIYVYYLLVFINVNVYKTSVPKACDDFRNYRFYVRAEVGNRHHAPHLHVEWPDDSCVLLLPTLELLGGTPIPRDAREYILENLDVIVENWNRYNASRE